MLNRQAAQNDVGDVTATIAAAFRDDPVWGVALHRDDGSVDHLVPYWGLLVEGAMRYQTVYVTDGAATTSVWIPPGGTELTDELESRLHTLVSEALPDCAQAVFELWDRFEASHPHDEPHAYLSLLATRPDMAGHGLGQAHLAQDLGRWDEQGIPAYLESSNPGNNHRYERFGFRKVGEFSTPQNGAVLTTMWRPVGG